MTWTRHGHAKPNGLTPTYRSWAAMKTRCLNPNASDYSHYGGRGISICDRWLGRDGYTNFLADMGERPDNHTLERRDSSRNYEPGNCRWATRTEQARNRACVKLEEHEPEQIRWLASVGYSQVSIAKHFDIAQSTVSSIVRMDSWRPLCSPVHA